MSLIINPCDRLGNNISQIIRTVKYNNDNLNMYNIDLKLLKNFQKEIFKNFPDNIIFRENNNPDICDMYSTFWNVIPDLNNKYIVDTYIKPYIDYEINNEIENLKIDFNNDLIIHIRSGDLFNMDFHELKHYIQPPFYYYKKIIDEGKYNKIIILSENYNLNPCINEILKTCKNSIFLSNSLDIDFKIMLNAKYFVTSLSSLCIAINDLSKFKKIIYCFNEDNYGWLKGCNTYNDNNEKINIIIIDISNFLNYDFKDKYDVLNKMIL